MLLGFGRARAREVRDTLTTDAPFAPNAFLRIDRAGKVTFVMPMIEMGQGTYTSLPMLIAEELEVDVDKVAIEHSPADDKVYVNPLIGAADDRRLDGHSRDVCPAAARGCDGARHAGDGRSAALERRSLDAAARRTGWSCTRPAAASSATARSWTPRRSCRCPRRSRSRTPRNSSSSESRTGASTLPARSTARAKFGIDTRLPGMKFAVVAASPTFGGKLVAVDEAKAKAVPGVSQVVRLEDAVAVVAVHTWAAKQGLAAAAPQWDAGPNAKLSTADIVAQLASASEKPGVVARHDGDAAAAIAGAARKIDAVYEQPFLAHADDGADELHGAHHARMVATSGSARRSRA